MHRHRAQGITVDTDHLLTYTSSDSRAADALMAVGAQASTVPTTFIGFSQFASANNSSSASLATDAMTGLDGQWSAVLARLSKKDAITRFKAAEVRVDPRGTGAVDQRCFHLGTSNITRRRL